MSDEDLINPAGGIIKSTSQNPKVRARSFNIKTSSKNLEQYKRTIIAYMQAGLTFEDIAWAGDFIGDEVVKEEIDAMIAEGWQEKTNEIAEDDSKMLAWQSRGETVSVANILPSVSTINGTEIINISKSPAVLEESTQDSYEVVEGIAVAKTELPELSEVSNNTSPNPTIQDSPFLQKVVGEIKKAA